MMGNPRRTPPPRMAESARVAMPSEPDTEAAMQPGSFWAVLTGTASGTNRYGFTAIDEGDVSTFNPVLATDFATSGEPVTGQAPAYEINGRVGIPTDGSVRVRLWPAGDLTYYLFSYPEQVTGSIIDGTPTYGPPGLTAASGSSGISGWTDTTCLVMVVEQISGRCSNIDRYQQVFLTTVDGTTWNSTNDFAGTGSSGSGPVTFVRASPPTLDIDGTGAYALGPISNGWLFEADGETLCGATSVPCSDYMTVSIRCVTCSVSSQSVSASTITNRIASPGSSISTRFIVPPTSGAPKALRLCLSQPCAGGFSGITVTLTAPDTTVYTLISAPTNLTSREGDFVLDPLASTAIDTLTEADPLYGVYAPDDDFTAYTGPTAGIWTLTVSNAGACNITLTCANMCFGTVSTGLSGFSVVTIPTGGTAPQTVTLDVTITGTPIFYSIDWGDGSALEWVQDAEGEGHTFASNGSYEIIVRAYGACGGYVEASYPIYIGPTVSVSCTGSPVPETLNWAIDNITGDCTCIVTTSGTVTYDSMNDWWGDVAFSCLLGECEENATYRMKCQVGGWEYGASGGGFSATSVTAAPFEVVFAGKPTVGTGTYRIRFYA